MKEKKLFWLLIFISFSTSAQLKGVVKDSISGKPISYVNIWVQNENIGSTSEENGEFSINTTADKNLIFSALGYEKKVTKISKSTIVTLKPIEYQLDEVVVAKKFQSKQIEIGKTENPIYQAFDNGPRIDVKYFPYKSKYIKTKFIKQVAIETDSKIENASFKIHFYSVDNNGFPGEELLKKDFIVSVKQGLIKTFFNVLDFNLRMPKNGIFIGFEKLLIEKNKIEKEVTNYNTNITKTQKIYYPFILYNYIERDSQYTFSGGKWNINTKQKPDGTLEKITIYEPAINLVLTN
jgi:hypothetical protein